jgi:hypothetical protein
MSQPGSIDTQVDFLLHERLQGKFSARTAAAPYEEYARKDLGSRSGVLGREQNRWGAVEDRVGVSVERGHLDFCGRLGDELNSPLPSGARPFADCPRPLPAPSQTAFRSRLYNPKTEGDGDAGL